MQWHRCQSTTRTTTTTSRGFKEAMRKCSTSRNLFSSQIRPARLFGPSNLIENYLCHPQYSTLREGTEHGFPTNIVFKENPGGEFRKSYHGYPSGKQYGYKGKSGFETFTFRFCAADSLPQQVGGGANAGFEKKNFRGAKHVFKT